MKGWLYHVDYPGMDTWQNASPKGIYHILDAPHVLEQNRNPKWVCLECGYILSGTMEPDDCPECSRRGGVEELCEGCEYCMPWTVEYIKEE